MDYTPTMAEAVPTRLGAPESLAVVAATKTPVSDDAYGGAAAEPTPDSAAERPAMDIFQAIFSDSSSDEEDDPSDAPQATARGGDLPACAPVMPAPYHAEDGDPDDRASRRTGGHPTDDRPARELKVPVDKARSAHPTAHKLTLVHTYNNLTQQQQQRQSRVAAYDREPTDVGTAHWVERSQPDQERPKKSKKDKKDKKSKSRSKREKKDKKKKKGKRKDDHSRGDSSGSDDSDNGETLPDQDLLAKMRRINATNYARASAQPPPRKEPAPVSSRLSTATSTDLSRKSHRPTAADFM
jgi:hypothetical protein